MRQRPGHYTRGSPDPACSSPSLMLVDYHLVHKNFGHGPRTDPAKEKSRNRCGSLFYLRCETREIRTDLLRGMLVFVDGLAHIVLALVEVLLLSLGQMSVVSGHVFLLRILNFLFALLQMRSLLWR